jgi:plastocyanin
MEAHVLFGSRHITTQVLALAALGFLAACGGGGSSSPTSPSSPVTGSPGPSGATITIGANGAISPSQVTVATGQSVTFINNDSRAHDMSSDPHPTHTDCPQLNAVSVLSPGQTKPTNAFTVARTCGFHDHNNPDSTALQGRIVIQ